MLCLMLFLAWSGRVFERVCEEQNAKKLDYFTSTWPEEHVRNRKDGKVVEERDFMDAMLSLLADDY